MNNKKEINQSNSGQKTVYFVWNYLQWGGVQIYFLGLMRNISPPFNVKAVLPKNSDGKILEYLKENKVEYDFFEGEMDSSNAATVSRRILRRWRDFQVNLSLAGRLSKYDLKNSIIQIDVAPWAGFVLLFYLALKTNVFVTFHTALPEISILRRILWKIKFSILTALKSFHIAASNADVKKSLRRFVSPERLEKIEIIYSSVNLKEIEPVMNEEERRQFLAEKYDFPSDKIWICNVAQFIDRKGCWVFLEAAESLLKKRDDLFFFWLGTSTLTEETIEKIKKFNLGNNFRFLSAVEIGDKRADLLRLWKAADLFVLPSFQEGLPMSLVEAMALKKACIASAINAIPEALTNYETGILVEAGDYAKLAYAIELLADDPILRKQLGEQARKYVAEHFDEKITGQKMRRIYENLCG